MVRPSLNAHQNCALEISDSPQETCGVILELTQAAVAIETKNPPDKTGFMVMIDMDGGFSPTDRAHSLLSSNHRLHLVCSDTVSPHKMVVTIAAMQPFLRLFSARVMAWLAVGVVTVLDVLVAGKFLQRLFRLTVWTDLSHTWEELITFCGH
jgi:hypothetical protein